MAEPVDLDVAWIHGAPSARTCTDPPLQVHAATADTVIMRQSKALNYEGPFLYLLFGAERAILLDTGATADPGRFPLRSTVDRLIEERLGAHPRDGYELVVAHTHAHGDHVAADAQFADRPGTVVVGHTATEVAAFFGITDWPEQEVAFDLGARVLTVFGIPGHHEASIAVYDPATQLLLTGDTVYPGRLYVSDFPQFRASLDRLVAFAATHPVSHVLGCHIEMTSTPGRDYPIGTTYQPQEAPLPMSVAQLSAVRDAAASVADKPGAHQFDDFAIFNGPCRGAVIRQLGRTLTAAGKRRARAVTHRP